jgi:protein-S-isoprenylcysteine O-methyltransferase Ste14
MKLYQSLMIFYIGTFVIDYFVMSAIQMDVPKDAGLFNFNLGKSYKSALIATFVTSIFVMMHDNQYNVFSYKYYIGMVLMVGIYIYLYRNQIEIKDEQFLREMNENSSNAILISEGILKKTNNFDVARFAKNVLQKSKDEMNIIYELNGKLNKNRRY